MWKTLTDIPLKKTYRWLRETHEKMINIAHSERNKNQNYNEVSPHINQNGNQPKLTNIKCWRGCDEKGILLHCWWKCKLIQPL